jgi:hypothetical protein
MAAFPSNGSWDGLIEPTGKTLRALNNPHQVRLAPAHPAVVDEQVKKQGGHEPVKASAPSDKSALIVPQGQVTFDAEGNDNPKSPYFSRQLHWPGEKSGVTIGRGYDMGYRTSAIVKSDLISAGVSPGLAERYSAGAGLIGEAAKKFVHENKGKVDLISPEAQKRLFSDVVYPKYVTTARSAYIQASAKKGGVPLWDNLDVKVRDIAVDLRYQQPSIYNNQMQAIQQNDREALANVIKSDPRTNKYEAGRGRAKYLQK